MKIPEEVEHKILAELGITDIYNNPKLFSEKIDNLRKQMTHLSEDFARLKPTESQYQDAYFAFNFPQNFVKAMLVMNKIYNLYKIPLLKEKIKILDLGCGEGAAMLGLYYGLKNIKPDISIYFTGVDIENSLLNRCRLLLEWLQHLYGNVHFDTVNRSALDFITDYAGEYNIIIISNVLVEIFSGNNIPINFMKKIIRLLQSNGIIIIIEPALKPLARRLMKFADWLKKHGTGYILLPCLHHNSCPLLAKRNEWCHQSIEWKPPEYMKILNQPLYRKIEYLKFSYLVISRQNYGFIKDNTFVVISRLFKEKGRKRALLCGRDGVVELVRLDRDMGRKNLEFDIIGMGDIVQMEKEIRTRKLYWKIAKDTEIKRLDF